MKKPGFDDDSEDTTPRLPVEAVLEALGVRWPPHGLSIQEILALRGFTVTPLDLGPQTMTLQRFAKLNPTGKYYFTVKGAFILALVDGRLTDSSGGKLDKRFLRTAFRVEDPVLEEAPPVPSSGGLVEELLAANTPGGAEVVFSQKAEPVTRVRRRVLKKPARQRRGSG